MIRVRLTPRADKDIESILDQTLVQFGPMQVERYASILERGLGLIADSRERPAVQARPELGRGVRSFHLAHAASRRAAAAHVVYFRIRDQGRRLELEVLRVLHERMEPHRRLRRAIGEDEKPWS